MTEFELTTKDRSSSISHVDELDELEKGENNPQVKSTVVGKLTPIQLHFEDLKYSVKLPKKKGFLKKKVDEYVF